MKIKVKALDRKQLALIADWAIAAVAVSLPWSTSATSILLVVWLLALLPTLDFAMVRREVETPAGGLPVLLWLLAAVGMLWAEVSWADRIHGLGAFHRLLAIPLLLAQFRRSGHGVWVLYGFLASDSVLLLVSWALALTPGLPWRGVRHMVGVPVKEYISQSTLFLVCAFALLWRVFDLLRERNWRASLLLGGLALLFLADLAFVVTSRTVLGVIPVLIVLFGWRQFGWKGAAIACSAGLVLAVGLWETSSNIREKLLQTAHEVQAYNATQEANSTGLHIEFLKRSVTFIREAPLIGHGTGSLAELFHQSTAWGFGAAGVAASNPHNQIFAVALQLGLVGVLVLLAMWTAHYFMFRSTGWMAWVGTVVVVENIVSAAFNSHLFDFTQGWLYAIGVGVVGGMVLRQVPDVPVTEAPALAHR